MKKGIVEMKTRVINNGKNEGKPILYIDMDGTIVDFVYAMNNEMTPEDWDICFTEYIEYYGEMTNLRGLRENQKMT